MALNYTPPSLSELLAAYKNNNAGDAINALNQGVQTGMGIAQKRKQFQLDQQNKQAELANQGITAAAAQATAANGAVSAAAQQKEAEAKFVPVEVAERNLNLPPGTLGQPGAVVPQAYLDNLASNARAKETNEATIRAAQIAKDAALANSAAIAHQASEDRHANTANAARTTNMSVGQAAQASAAAHAPGFWGNVGNVGYRMLPWTHGDLPSVQAYKQEMGTAQNLLGNNAGSQSVLGRVDATTRYNQIKASGVQNDADIYAQLHKEGY